MAENLTTLNVLMDSILMTIFFTLEDQGKLAAGAFSSQPEKCLSSLGIRVDRTKDGLDVVNDQGNVLSQLRHSWDGPRVSLVVSPAILLFRTFQYLRQPVTIQSSHKEWL